MKGEKLRGRQRCCCYVLLEEPVPRLNDLSFIEMFTKWVVEWGKWFAKGEKVWVILILGYPWAEV